MQLDEVRGRVGNYCEVTFEVEREGAGAEVDEVLDERALRGD